MVSEGKLTARTRELVELRPRTVTYAHIEQATGVSARWIEAFGKNRVKRPCCDSVEAVYVFLSGKSLDV